MLWLEDWPLVIVFEHCLWSLSLSIALWSETRTLDFDRCVWLCGCALALGDHCGLGLGPDQCALVFG